MTKDNNALFHKNGKTERCLLLRFPFFANE